MKRTDLNQEARDLNEMQRQRQARGYVDGRRVRYPQADLLSEAAALTALDRAEADQPSADEEPFDEDHAWAVYLERRAEEAYYRFGGDHGDNW